MSSSSAEIPHTDPEVARAMAAWEERYQQGDTGWDQGEPTPALRKALEFFPEGGRVLVPGCGYGHDAHALAEGGLTVEGWDVAPSALETARHRYRLPSLSFHQRDVLAPPRETGGFDGIFEHTFLCAIGPEGWPNALRSFARLLKPGGRIFAILFTGLENDDPPPWPITAEEVRELFYPEFRLLSVEPLEDTFEQRRGKESLWRFQLPAE